MKANTLPNFAGNLRRERQRLGLTQEALAAKLRCSRVYVTFLETGQRTPSTDLLMRAARVLRVTLDRLVGTTK